jgi:type VI secretion system protein ImpL
MLKDNMFLLSLAVLIVLVLLVLGMVLYVAARRSDAKPATDPKRIKMRFDSLRSSFRQAVELIESNIASRRERYSLPWVLVLNEGEQQQGLPIEQAGVASALSTESANSAAAQGIAWHFFDKGIVIDMQGAYLGSPDDDDAAEKPWDEFLGLCRTYRPQRPFDSVVITVPASYLIDSSPDAGLELAKMARLSHRRLWLAQNRFAMRFAVYVVVSGCDQIEGFSAFARTLPESMRAGMLGWSSPYDLSTTYQSEWVDDAVSSIVKTMSDTTAELFAVQPPEDTGKYFLLPSRIAAMQAQLKVYTDELMRPSAYHEPFFFRGIYLTGDSSEAAQKAIAVPNLSDASPEQEARDEGIPVALPVVPVSNHMREPAFLKDLFEKKIFLEYGVARPSRQQLARPVVSKVARWSAITVLGVWGAGLLVATVQLNQRNPELVKALVQIEKDANQRARAAERGEVLPPEWYRARTLALLAEIEKLGTGRAWTFFMPGSWAVIDDLDQRVTERIEREFGETAINTLRRELYTRASELTGVTQDDSSAELIIGGECKVPAGFAALVNAPHKATLNLEDLPEFAALLQYLTAVEQLDQAMLAMVRLQKANENESEDLRKLVKYTLGAELSGNMTQSLRFFRAAEESGGLSPATISVMHIQQAVRCSLEKATAALDQRLFLNNDLLVSERQLASQSVRLFSNDGRVAGFVETVSGYKEMLAAIREQEALLATGKGIWMRQPNLNLGPAYDAALQRIAQSRRLMGGEAAELAKQQATDAYAKFSNEFAARFGNDMHAGLVWSDKEQRFALSPSRLALRDSLNLLLAQPFMTPPTDRDIPAFVSQSNVLWDAPKLDQALALSESRKRYLAEAVQKFPQPYVAGVTAFVNSQFSRLMSDQILDAMSTTGRSDPGSMNEATAFDTARSRLSKIQEVFYDLGERTKADSLQSLLSQDALQRLRQLDSKMQQSDLYAIRGRDFGYWSGERGPVLQAFGVPDGAALQQYLGLQFSRMESLGRQAEIFLSAMDSVASDSQLARRWQAINRELERYRLKNPNGSLIAYEQFLTTVGAEVDRFTCADKLSGKNPGVRAVDYFSERHVQVYHALQKRCSELYQNEQQEQWAAFSVNFNRLLAGHIPFAAIHAKDAPDADYEDVGQVIKSFDRVARLFKETSANQRSNSQWSAARRFAEQFDRVRAVMAPLYPADDSAVAGYDLNVEFRANQAAELEGNKVIDWVLDIGSQTQRLRDAPRALRWEPGSSITLTLRLAKDSPFYALPDLQQSNMVTDGKTISYRFADGWSLFRLIQRQRESDPAARSDGRSVLLRMEFPLENRAADPGSVAELRGKVYLRLAVSPVGKRTPLAWPMVFPLRAPE